MTPKLTVAASRLITLLDEPSVSIDAFDSDTKHSLVTAIEDTRAALMEVNADPRGAAVRTASATPEGWEDILAAVRREVAANRDTHRGNCPAHGHSTPGIWDRDNGPLAGQPCALCMLWHKAAAMLNTPTPTVPPDVIADADPLQGAVDWLVKAIDGCKLADIQRNLLIGYNRASRLLDAGRAAEKGTPA